VPNDALSERLPRRIEALQDVRVRCVAAGRRHSCAVTDEGHVYTWGCGRAGALGHMKFQDEVLPEYVELLHDEGVVAVGVAAGDKHTLVADADGSVWGFGYLNAIGAWSNATVKRMHEDEDDTVDPEDVILEGDDYHNYNAEVDGSLFGWPGYKIIGEGGEPVDSDAFEFLYPRGRASISMPVRIPVDVRGAVLAGAASIASHA
jgi:alpha-tubulin suppressor-like RCC1 family protein